MWALAVEGLVTENPCSRGRIHARPYVAGESKELNFLLCSKGLYHMRRVNLPVIKDANVNSEVTLFNHPQLVAVYL